MIYKWENTSLGDNFSSHLISVIPGHPVCALKIKFKSKLLVWVISLVAMTNCMTRSELREKGYMWDNVLRVEFILVAWVWWHPRLCSQVARYLHILEKQKIWREMMMLICLFFVSLSLLFYLILDPIQKDVVLTPKVCLPSKHSQCVSPRWFYRQ